MPTRCRSNCTTNKSVESCNAADKCSYTNGPKRKFCRLSSKYKMNKPDCNITRKFRKREKGAAEKIRRFMTKLRASSKKRTQKNLPEFTIHDITQTPPALANAPTNEEIKRITDKAHTRRIQRFMKAVNPHKRRSAYLNGVCSDSGVCIAFGKHVETIKKHFNRFIDFKHAKSLRQIGVVSANGFVKEIEYENAGYKSHAVLKSTTREKADNLYYEYLVGLFLNEQSKYSPIFLETYASLRYASNNKYESMKNQTATKDTLNDLSIIQHPGIQTENLPFPPNKMLELSCKTSLHTALLIQHIKDAKTLSAKCGDIDFAKIDLVNILFQIYYTLRLLSRSFTHNDLHTDNVLVYEPVKDGYIQYYYHTTPGTVYAFKSAYIPKMIDYGRSFYDFGRLHKETDVFNSSRTIYKTVCKMKLCKPCGIEKGYQWLTPSTTSNSAHDPNISQDLRLLRMLHKAYDDFGTVEYSRMVKTIYRHSPVSRLLEKVQFKGIHFTPQDINMGTAKPKPKSKTINNIIDAYVMLVELIQSPKIIAANEEHYAKHKKIGEMHVYEDRPLEFISAE